MRALLATLALCAFSACLIDPPIIEGKRCDVARGCPDGYTCVADEGAEEGICRSSVGCEGEAPACELTAGVCALSRQQCGVAEWKACTQASYPATYEPFELTCNDSLDNDCDGRLDISTAVKVSSPVLGFDVRRSVDAGYVLALRETSGGGSRIVSYGLTQTMDVRSTPTILSTTDDVTFGPAVSARSGFTGVTWAERSASDGGEEVWFALVNTLGQLTSVDGGVSRRVVARSDVASAPQTAWLSVTNTHLVAWADDARQLMTVFVDDNGFPTTAVRPLPHNAPLGDVYDVAITERINTSDGDNFAAAWVAKDGGQNWIGYRIFSPANLTIDYLKEGISSPARSPRIARTYKYGASSNINWYAWVEERGTNDAIRIRSSYGPSIDSVAELISNSTPVTDMHFVVSDDDKLIVAWTDGSKVYFGTSDALKGSGNIAFGGNFGQVPGTLPVIAPFAGSHALFFARDAGEVYGERHCGP